MEKYDFSGWATRNDLRCSDGRTIRRDAFKADDGRSVPLVWNHQHNDPDNVLGHALLENRDDGVYAYCKLNETESGQIAKVIVSHGDVSALSIYANQLKQNGGDVIHGKIREVSLVLAGANPGAMIDTIIAHSDDDDEEAVIYTGEGIVLEHADKKMLEEEPKKEETPKEEPKTNQNEDKETKTMAVEPKKPENEETVQDVFDTLTEKQKMVVYAIIGQALEDAGVGEEDEKVKHNVFDSDRENQEEVLSHSEMQEIFNDAKRIGSLKESFLQHGIENIGELFPDAKAVTDTPEWIKRDDSWVNKVLNPARHTPFSRIKSMAANITENEARAKGYLADHTHRDNKGHLVDADGNPVMKKEEVFSLLKRVTTPTTVYKKQKLDRDDQLDITEMDVVAWLKGEMRGMLREEIARAALIGDGRQNSDEDKISETNIRPIWTDAALYTTRVQLPVGGTVPTAKKFITAIVMARKNYKGSGNPTLFTTEDMLTECLLLEDLNGRRIYENVETLATAMRVKEIITVPVMENQTRTDTTLGTCQVHGIVVNMADYTIGMDKGGEVNMFDDFDIDYNQQKYLIETRCSGALTKPYSAIAVEEILPDEPEVEEDDET